MRILFCTLSQRFCYLYNYSTLSLLDKIKDNLLCLWPLIQESRQFYSYKNPRSGHKLCSSIRMTEFSLSMRFRQNWTMKRHVNDFNNFSLGRSKHGTERYSRNMHFEILSAVDTTTWRFKYSILIFLEIYETATLPDTIR